MASVTDALARAIKLAEARYSDEEWYQLSPRTRTAAIYEELARLDAETARISPPIKWERRKRPRRAADRQAPKLASTG